MAIGCAGGRHRACGLTELLARELRDRGRQVEIEHLHAHLPRVLKTPTDSRTSHPEQETA
ncbi:RapZ C-terminal domain-containing protein [Streptomyces griseus]|uniref:RapZ C-terminal domain-containing protein n=1 Tax=Streptomyces griseus TaxID=1911 RepID=UPI003F4BA89C